MRHRKKTSALGKGSLQKKRIIQQLARSLVMHGKLETTLSRAKKLRPYVERLVTSSRSGTVAARRKLFQALQNDRAVRALIETIGPRYRGRNGGYTRIVRTGHRRGDNAIRAQIAFIDVKKKDE